MPPTESQLRSPISAHRAIGALLAIGLLLLLRFGLALGAEGRPGTMAEPEAMGSIAGVVTDEAGAPLAGIEVRLQRLIISRYTLRLTTTDSNGAYRFDALLAGLYQVEFVDPSHQFAFQFYPNRSQATEAASIPVSGNDVSGIDARLVRGGAIAGIITGTRTLSLVSGTATLYRERTPGWWEEFRYYHSIDGGNAYHFAGLGTGFYRVCATAHTEGEYFRECYERVHRDRPIAEATPIFVSAGLTTTHIDFRFGDQVDYLVIAGFVYEPNGAPAEGVTARLLRKMDDGLYLEHNSRQQTDALGRFRFTDLAESYEYYLFAEDGAGLFERQFYAQASILAEATAIRFDETRLRDDIEITLTPGGRITGVVTVDGEVAPLSGVVYAIPEAEAPVYFAHYFSGEIQRETGRYIVANLPAGRYRVAYSASLDGAYFFLPIDWGSTLDSAPSVTVTTGATVPNINFDLGNFDGAITGVVTADGAPQAGIKVAVHAHSGSDVGTLLTYTYTGAAGVYHLRGLASGDYYLRASDPSGRYAGAFYQADDTTQRTPVPLPAGATVGSIDITLAAGGAIQGHVRRHHGAPMAAVGVYIYAYRDGAWRRETFEDVWTDANGNFKLLGLTPQNYRLYLSHPVYAAYSEYYPSAATLEEAADIAVQAGEVTVIADAILGPDAVLHLPVVRR